MGNPKSILKSERTHPSKQSHLKMYLYACMRLIRCGLGGRGRDRAGKGEGRVEGMVVAVALGGGFWQASQLPSPRQSNPSSSCLSTLLARAHNPRVWLANEERASTTRRTNSDCSALACVRACMEGISCWGCRGETSFIFEYCFCCCSCCVSTWDGVCAWPGLFKGCEVEYKISGL